MIDFLIQKDIELFLHLNGLHQDWLDSVMVLLSWKFTWLPLYLFSILLIIRKYKIKSWAIIIGIVLTITIADQVASGFFKPTIQRPRPCHEELIKEQVYIIDNHCGGQYGFFSSHSANSFGYAVFMFLLFANAYKWVKYLIFPWAVLVSYSRIYLGVHYPLDIFCGAICGILAALLCYSLTKWVLKKVYVYYL